MANPIPSQGRKTVQLVALILGMVCCSSFLSLQNYLGSFDPQRHLGSFHAKSPASAQQLSRGEEAVPPRCERAFRESNGFFRDVPEDQWLIRTKILRNRVLLPVDRMGARRYWQSNYNPEFTCEHADFFGQMGLGGAWLCDPHRIPKEKCIVYTFYSGQPQPQHDWYEDAFGKPFNFERSVKKRLPFCEIHIFDHKDQSRNVTQAGLNATFHQVALRNRLGVTIGEPSKPLGDIMKELGHEKITVLRMDLEGLEWFVYEEIAAANISQLSFQIHRLNREHKRRFWPRLLDAGYAIFHKDPVLYVSGDYVDFSLLKLSPVVRNNTAGP